MTSCNTFSSKVSLAFVEIDIKDKVLAGLEKKHGDKDHAASRTQEIRNNVIGDSGRATENYIETEK